MHTCPNPESVKLSSDGTSLDYSTFIGGTFGEEGKGIVVLGKYIDGIFYADEVFAKHDENYMPPEIADVVAEAHAEAGVANPVSSRVGG